MIDEQDVNGMTICAGIVFVATYEVSWAFMATWTVILLALAMCYLWVYR